jgi:hypothetical protein
MPKIPPAFPLPFRLPDAPVKNAHPGGKPEHSIYPFLKNRNKTAKNDGNNCGTDGKTELFS